MRETGLVEAHLRRLDDDATLAFVADLWAARGYEVSRERGVVVAERNGETTTLGTPASTGETDAVVATGRRSPSAATVLDAADLCELLRYAVEPATARSLCRRHLGDDPANLRPPVRLRARRALRSTTAWAPVLLVLVVVLAGATLVPALTDAPGDDSAADGPAADTTATPAGFDGVGADDEPGAGADETGAYRPDAGVEDLPGANRSGVTNVSALAAAHAAALENRTYALWYDESSPRTWTNGSRVNRDVDMSVADGRYRVVVSEQSGPAGRSDVVRRVYYDGSTWYVAEASENGTRYRSATDASSVGRSPFVLRETLVRRYLSTPETRYEGYIDQEGDILYRFVGTGTPDGLSPTGVSDYRVFVVVDDSGLVVLGNVEYTLSTESRSTAVRIRWTYGGFGETAVSPPTWYETAFGGSNETTRTPPE